MSRLEHDRGSPRLIFTREEREAPELKKPIAEAEKAADRYARARKRLKPKRAPDKARESPKTGNEKDDIPENDIRGESFTDAHGTDGFAASHSPDRDTPEPGTASGKRGQKNAHRRAADPDTGKKRGDQSRTYASRTTGTRTGPGASSAGTSVPAKNAPAPRLHFDDPRKRAPSKMLHLPVRAAVSTELRRRSVRAVDQDENNTAPSAVMKAEQTAATALHTGARAYHALKLRPYRAAEKAGKELDKANLRFLYAERKAEDPKFTSSPFSRWQQKRAIRREYAAAKAGRSTAFEVTAKTADKAVHTAAETARCAAANVRKSPKLLILLGILGGILILVMTGFQAITPLTQAVLESIAIGTYPADEKDVRAAEYAYAAKEQELKHEMDHYESLHPGYDEYHIMPAEIAHDPYVLIAIISAYFDGEEWDINKAYPVIEKYFNLQYIKTEETVTETRYRTETRRGTRIVTDPDTGETYTERYSYDVQVPYEYTIRNVKLENRDLSHMPVISMSHHTMGMYALYMGTHGNMEGIFAGNPNARPLRDPMLYDIPQSVLDADPNFARLIAEATKYIGYPYVWGGASPETSFDCSGFVSYVYTASGVCNTGRRGATGLHGMCREVSETEVRPGDLVFFEGTMGEGTPGITHVGIYVGDRKMLHCGSPIGYADLNEYYWRTHFHSYGRLPY